MCNEVHSDSKPIPPEGKGWKIFFEKDKMMLREAEYTKDDPDGWIDFRNVHWGDGFCFFLTREEARKVMRAWRRRYFGVYYASTIPPIHRNIRRIEYLGGLGWHLEDGMIAGHIAKIALCKSFKIIE